MERPEAQHIYDSWKDENMEDTVVGVLTKEVDSNPNGYIKFNIKKEGKQFFRWLKESNPNVVIICSEEYNPEDIPAMIYVNSLLPRMLDKTNYIVLQYTKRCSAEEFNSYNPFWQTKKLGSLNKQITIAEGEMHVTAQIKKYIEENKNTERN